MRKHINQYNLLKHLPPLSLLEFQYWSTNVLKNDILQNSIDTELIAERKEIRKLILGITTEKKNRKKNLAISNKYQLHIELSSDGMEFIYCLIRENSLPDVEHIDEAFSKLGNNHTINFIKDFLHEILDYSNFHDYNKGLQYFPMANEYEYNQDKDETIFTVRVRSDNNKEIIANYSDYLARNPESV